MTEDILTAGLTDFSFKIFSENVISIKSKNKWEVLTEFTLGANCTTYKNKSPKIHLRFSQQFDSH